MGTRALFLIAASLITGTALMVGMSRQATTNDAKVSEYQEEVLLNQIAKSAENLVIAQVKRDFDNAPNNINHHDVAMKGGHFSASATANGTDEVNVTVTASYGDMSRQITTTLQRSGSSGTMDAALMIDAPSANVLFTGLQYCIIGNDYNPPSIGGSSPGLHVGGVRATSSTVRDQIRTAMGPTRQNNIMGVHGEGDIYHDNFGLDVNKIYNDAITNVSDTHNGENISGVYGSAASPVVLHVTGDAILDGKLQGYGVLVVDGDLDTASGNLQWEGAVIVNKESDLLFRLDEWSRIFGGVIIMNGSSAFNMPANGTLDMTYYASNSSMNSALMLKPVGHSVSTLFSSGANSNGDQTTSWSTAYELGQQINFMTETSPASGDAFHRMARYNAPEYVAQPHAKVRALSSDSWEITFETGVADMSASEAAEAGVEAANWDYYDEKVIVNFVPDGTDPAGDNTTDWADTFAFNTAMSTSSSAVNIEFHGTGTIIYSSEAMARLTNILPSMNQDDAIIITERHMENLDHFKHVSQGD